MTRNYAFSVIIPTLNEADNIAATLQAARVALPSAELIVVDARSTDATERIARTLADQFLSASGGRGAQLDMGLRTAHGEIVVFLHADTLLPHDAASAIQHALGDRKSVGGAFRVRFAHADRRMRLIARAINLRSALFRTATGDQAIFARSEVLREVGGVPREPLFEDVLLYRALRARGDVRLLATAVTTSPRLWLARGIARVAFMHLLFRALHALGVSPARLAKMYPRRD